MKATKTAESAPVATRLPGEKRYTLAALLKVSGAIARHPMSIVARTQTPWVRSITLCQISVSTENALCRGVMATAVTQYVPKMKVVIMPKDSMNVLGLL